MKVKVLKEFIDKNTRELHRIEDIVEYPLERAQELIAGEWVEEIKEESAVEEEPAVEEEATVEEKETVEKEKPVLKQAPKKNSPSKSRGATK